MLFRRPAPERVIFGRQRGVITVPDGVHEQITPTAAASTGRRWLRQDFLMALRLITAPAIHQLAS